MTIRWCQSLVYFRVVLYPLQWWWLKGKVEGLRQNRSSASDFNPRCSMVQPRDSLTRSVHRLISLSHSTLRRPLGSQALQATSSPLWLAGPVC